LILKAHHIVFLFSFLVTFILIYILIKYAYKFKLIDHPDHRKIHKVSTPIVGGLGIVISFLFIIIISFYFNFKFINISSFEFLILFLSSLIIILTGLIDDMRGISAYNKFLFQIIAAIILVLGFKDFQIIDWPFFNRFESIYLTSFLSIFYLVSILNAINLIDGLDGLAGGVSIIISVFFIVLSLLSGIQIIEMYVLFSLLGSLCAFMIFNKPPAKTFLGDTGSLFIGWILGIVSLFYAQKTSLSLSILLPIMALGLPSFDVIFVMIKRFNSRHNYKLKERFKSIVSPDNNHLHHLTVDAGFSKRKSVIILYFITIFTNLIAIYSYLKGVNLLYGIILILFLIFGVRFMFLWKINKKVSK